MKEDYQHKKVRIKLNSDDIARLIKGETVVGWKTAVQKE